MRLAVHSALIASVVALSVGCGGGSAPATETAGGAPGAAPAANTDKNAYPVFPDADSGADPAVPPNRAAAGSRARAGRRTPTST